MGVDFFEVSVNLLKLIFIFLMMVLAINQPNANELLINDNNMAMNMDELQHFFVAHFQPRPQTQTQTQNQWICR